MPLNPNPLTAILAGLWTSLGMFPLELWLRGQAAEPGLMAIAVWLVAAIIFLALPGYLLVVGRNRAFGRNWIADPAERARYMNILRRIVIWIASTAVASVLWSLMLGDRAAG